MLVRREGQHTRQDSSPEEVDLTAHGVSLPAPRPLLSPRYLSRMILNIGYIMSGFTERKQALHDMIAGTLVFAHLTVLRR